MPELVYPAISDPSDAKVVWDPGGSSHEALAAMHHYGPGPEVGAALATISEHTAVLREAGLITTRRHGRRVLHTLTARGAILLD